MDEMLGSRPDFRPGALALQDEAELGGLRGRAVIRGRRHGREERESKKEQALHHGRKSFFQRAGRLSRPGSDIPILPRMILCYNIEKASPSQTMREPPGRSAQKMG
jgi:hypothetical protein